MLESQEVVNQLNNNTLKPKKLGGATGKGFMPGKSGNPKGRPPGQTLKEFQAQRFREMTDKQKLEWLEAHDVSPEVVWKMAEGNPANATDITSGGEKIIVMPSEIIKKNEK